MCAAAGSISGKFQPGYAQSLAIFPQLADRIRAKRIFILSNSLSAAALPRGGYRGSFLLTCLTPLVRWIVAWMTLASTANKVFPRVGDQGPSIEVLRNKSAVLFRVACALHCCELLRMWARTPAFLLACLMVCGSKDLSPELGYPFPWLLVINLNI
jgi:hypothetical protein